MPFGGGGGGGSLPDPLPAPITISETDGTSAGLVIETQGGSGISALSISAPHTTFSIDGDGGATFGSDDTAELNVVGSSGTDGILLVGDGTSQSQFTAQTGLTIGASGVNVAQLAHGVLIVKGLPTSDPGVSGQVYSVAGVLHVSP